MIDWAREIKILRREHRLSREDLGELCGTLSDRAVDLFGSFESGNQEPKGALRVLLMLLMEKPDIVDFIKERDENGNHRYNA